MTINVRLENANEDFLKAIKSIAKASGVKIRVKREYEPSPDLLEAIEEIKNGGTVCKSMEEFNKSINE